MCLGLWTGGCARAGRPIDTGAGTGARHPDAEPSRSGDSAALEPAAATPEARELEAPRASRDAGALEASRASREAGAIVDGGAPRALNVLYLTVDSLRGDVLSARGSAPPAFGEDPTRIAPNLTALARRGVQYRRAYALSSYTSMSVGGMYGGRLPGELARDGYFFGTYRPSVLTLAERLTAAGVHTMAAHAHFYFRRGGSGLEQGFARWEVIPGLVRDNTTDVEVTGERHVALCEQLLSEPAVRDRPWFLHAHFMDPHDQYKRHAGAPEMRVARGARALYLGEVWFSDGHLGRLLEFVARQPWADRTAVIVSADHGEAFGEHGHFRHGFYLWEELVRVPWIFVFPGARPRVIDAPRSHLDLVPTVLDLMGLPPDPSLRGVSLRAELEGADPPARPVWVDLPRTSDNERWRSRIEGELVTIARGEEDGSFLVYDLAADPEQRAPLPRTDPRRAAAIERYRAERGQWRDVAPDRWRPAAR